MAWGGPVGCSMQFGPPSSMGILLWAADSGPASRFWQVLTVLSDGDRFVGPGQLVVLRTGASNRDDAVGHCHGSP